MPEIESSRPVIHLDDMLETADAASWMGLCERKLLAKGKRAKGKAAKIPGFWLNQNVVRWNPRTIIAKLAADAGVAPEVIAAMFKIEIKQQP